MTLSKEGHILKSQVSGHNSAHDTQQSLSPQPPRDLWVPPKVHGNPLLPSIMALHRDLCKALAFTVLKEA